MKTSRPRAHRQRITITISSFVLVAAIAGCGIGSGHAPDIRAATAGTSVTAGSSTQTVSVHGTKRTFHVYVPAHSSGALPLVVMLHGGFGSGTQAERSYHWDSEADAGHFVVAYPDGLNRAWNAGGGC